MTRLQLDGNKVRRGKEGRVRIMSWGFSCALLALSLVLAIGMPPFFIYLAACNYFVCVALGVEDYDMYGYQTDNSSNSTTNSPTTGATTHIVTTTNRNTTNGSATTATTPIATTLAPVPPSTTYVLYKLNDTNKRDQACFRMNTSISVMISSGIGKNETVSMPGTVFRNSPYIIFFFPQGKKLPNTTFKGTPTNQSFCSIEKSEAKIFLEDTSVHGVTLGIILSAVSY